MTSRASTFDPHCAAMTLERRSPSHAQSEKKVLWLFEHRKSNQYKQGGQGTKRSITCWKVMATPTSRCQELPEPYPLRSRSRRPPLAANKSIPSLMCGCSGCGIHPLQPHIRLGMDSPAMKAHMQAHYTVLGDNVE